VAVRGRRRRGDEGRLPGWGRPTRSAARRSSRVFADCRRTASRFYYLHRVDPETPLEDSLAALKEYRDSGKIRHVGLSEVGIDQIERASEVLPIAAVQNHYNLSERRHEDVVDYCARYGIVQVVEREGAGRRWRAPRRDR